MKAMKGLMIVLCLVMVGMAWGYATWQEAVSAGNLKSNAKDYAGARADYVEALALTQKNDEKLEAQFRVADTYYDAGDYAGARGKYSKVLALGIDTWWYPNAHLQLGRCAEVLGDFVAAKTSYMQALSFPGGVGSFGSKAFDALVRLRVDYPVIITALGVPQDWSGYFFLAKAQDASKQFNEALASCDAGFDLLKGLDDDGAMAAKRKLLTLRGDIAWRAKDKSYGDIVSP